MVTRARFSVRSLAVVAVLLGVAAVSATPVLAADKPFDPGRDPAKDLRAAEDEARSGHKNILMDVGGNWCPWCILLDRTLGEDTQLRALLQQNFVVLRVNWSREQQNTDFLSKFPPAKGYPSWYVLSADGKLLTQKDTSELEQDHKLQSGYNKQALKEFLEKNRAR